MPYVSQCLRLFALHVRMQLGLSVFMSNLRHDRKKFWQGILIIVCAVYGFGVIVVGYGLLFRSILTAAGALSLGAPLLIIALLLSMVTTLILGTFQLVSVVFHARDLEWYASMPLKPGAVFFAKLGMAYLMELAATVLMLTPVYVVYAGTGEGGVYFIAAAILSMPFVPLLPMAIAAALALPLSLLSVRMPKRGMFAAILTMVLIAGITVAGMVVPTAVARIIEEDPEILTRLIADNQELIRLIAAAFPPAAWLANGLTGSPLRLLLFIAVSICVLAAVIAMAERLYYRTALVGLEGRTVRKAVQGAVVVSEKTGALPVTLALSELKQLFRSPLYLMNSSAGMFVALSLLVMPLALGDQMNRIHESLGEYLNGPDFNGALVTAIYMLTLTFMGMFNAAGSTAVSREGKCFWISMTLPLKPRDQIVGKFFGASCITVLTQLAFAICAAIVLPELLLWLAASFLPSVLAALAATAFSMLPDILKPKLKWDSEAEAMKQNLNTLLGMLICLPVIVVLCLFVLPAAIIVRSLPLLLILSSVLGAGMLICGVLLIRHAADSAYPRLGERL